MQIAIYGGGFNPPTVAYLEVIQALLELKKFDQIWLMPYFERAFGKTVTTAAMHRLSMAQLLADVCGSGVQVCDLEVRQAKRSFTIETQRALLQLYPEHEFDWIIGSDLLAELPRWKESEALCQMTHFVVVARAGYVLDEVELERFPVLGVVELASPLAVSSSQVRAQIQQQQVWQKSVIPSIATYILDHKLYGVD